MNRTGAFYGRRIPSTRSGIASSTPNLSTREMVNAADYAVFPRIIYHEESLGDIAGRTR
jgi:hypothetical protein